jgi:hypothetical protein
VLLLMLVVVVVVVLLMLVVVVVLLMLVVVVLVRRWCRLAGGAWCWRSSNKLLPKLSSKLLNKQCRTLRRHPL